MVHNIISTTWLVVEDARIADSIIRNDQWYIKHHYLLLFIAVNVNYYTIKNNDE